LRGENMASPIVLKELNFPTLEDPDLSAKEPELFFKKCPRN